MNFFPIFAIQLYNICHHQIDARLEPMARDDDDLPLQSLLSLDAGCTSSNSSSFSQTQDYALLICKESFGMVVEMRSKC
jgi:hypothetical protein